MPSQEILGPPPAGSNWRVKLLWYAADAVATGIVYTLFDYGIPINPAPATAEDPDPDTWMHVQVKYEDIGNAAFADDQMFTLDVINYTNDAVDNTWTAGDFDNVNTAINQYCTALAPLLSPNYRCAEFKYYRRLFNPREIAKPYPDAGGPAHVHTTSILGTGTAGLPPQVTTTITEITASRKHWGRMYLPTLGFNAMNATGRLLTTAATTICTAAETLAVALNNSGFRLVVPTTSSGGIYDPTVKGDWTTVIARTLQQVNSFRVDDVVDSHRSRRNKQALVRVDRPTP